MRLLSGYAVIVLSLLIAGSAPTQSRSSATGPPARDPGNLPPGWSARTDDAGEAKNIKFVVMEPGYHLSPGPATILYRDEDTVSASFHTLATFHQMNQPKHAEGYGLFIGGRALQEKGQQYTYFLVRNDGTYLIKRRSGDQTTEISKGWTPHRAVRKGDAEGKTTNLLEIDAKKDPTQVRFKINGEPVHTAATNRMALGGVVGLRINHNLDVHIEGFAVHR